RATSTDHRSIGYLTCTQSLLARLGRPDSLRLGQARCTRYANVRGTKRARQISQKFAANDAQGLFETLASRPHATKKSFANSERYSQRVTLLVLYFRNDQFAKGDVGACYH